MRVNIGGKVWEGGKERVNMGGKERVKYGEKRSTQMYIPI